MSSEEVSKLWSKNLEAAKEVETKFLGYLKGQGVGKTKYT